MAQLQGAIGLDDIDPGLTGGIALDCLLGHGHRIAPDALLDAHAHIHARQKSRFRVRKFAAQGDLAGV